MRAAWSYITRTKFLRQANGWLAIFWIIMIPVSIVTGWINSITYVSALSLWALVAGHWAAWQAGRTETKQDEMNKANPDIDTSDLDNVD